MKSFAGRIRCPVHNIIEFDNNEFEKILWEIIQTEPFQRLRRIKQLAFAELIYPGATHTRFAHSLGVFFTAKKLMSVIKNKQQSDFNDEKAKIALAASLLHDLGHGPFSHAFEYFGRKIQEQNNIAFFHAHEEISKELITEGIISKLLKKHTSHFDEDVANAVAWEDKNIYNAVVTSQFDADRLDYMQRDRLMTGAQHGQVDISWLLSNLEIGKIKISEDEEVETFIMGEKGVYATESYLINLYQLYPVVYFHKTSRAAEKVFVELLMRIFSLVKEKKNIAIGLGENHPIINYCQSLIDGKKELALKNYLLLDDFVILGSLALLIKSKDEVIKKYAEKLHKRELPKCIDLTNAINKKFIENGIVNHREKERYSIKLQKIIESENTFKFMLLIDKGSRGIYKSIKSNGDDKGPLNQIYCKHSGDIKNISEALPQIVNYYNFDFFRVYTEKENLETVKKFIQNCMVLAGS